MPRFYMHLIDSTGAILDPDGIEMPLQAVIDAALLQARDCMAGDVKDGHLDLGCHIDVHDESGGLVHSLAFSDALIIVRSS